VNYTILITRILEESVIKVDPSGGSDPTGMIDPLKPGGPGSSDPNKPAGHIDEKYEITIVYIYDE